MPFRTKLHADFFSPKLPGLIMCGLGSSSMVFKIFQISPRPQLFLLDFVILFPSQESDIYLLSLSSVSSFLCLGLPKQNAAHKVFSWESFWAFFILSPVITERQQINLWNSANEYKQTCGCLACSVSLRTYSITVHYDLASL